MRRFEAKQMKILNREFWCVVDNKSEQTGKGLLFGDHQPRDKEEAEQCARAANLAWSTFVQEIKQLSNIFN